MKGVILDVKSLGDVNLSPITDLLDGWDLYDSTPADAVGKRIAGASIVLSNKIPLTDADMAAAPDLKLVSVMATGTNNVDLTAAARHDITVSNAVAYATPSVVQHTISLMLALSTRLLDYVHDVRAGAWQHSEVFCLLDHPITELAGKTLGIVGYGELGRNVARVAEAFGMQTLISRKIGVEDTTEGRVPFEQLVGIADYISLHCPLTPETRHLIDEETLGAMKTSAYLINTARGGLVHPEALITALENDIVAGAAVDVLDGEPPDDTEPLINARLGNLIVTPHNAWGAIESRQRLVMQMRENILAHLEGAPVRVVS